MADSHENQVLKKPRFVRQIARGIAGLKKQAARGTPCFITAEWPHPDVAAFWERRFWSI